jgi:cell division protein FtsI/penicillin-binding protein 2
MMTGFIFMIVFTLVTLGFIAFIVFINLGETQTSKNIEFINQELNRIIADKKFIDRRRRNAMALNLSERAIYLITEVNSSLQTEKYHYKDILQVEILEDSLSTTSTSRAGVAGRALLGGIIAGGVGAIVGGLSAKQVHRQSVQKIELQIVVNDPISPVRRVEMVHFYKAAETNSADYITSKNKAIEWFKTLEVLMHQADQEDGVHAN